MTSLPLYWADAFTSRRFAGNACAIVLDTEDLSDATMATIAREMNLSETAFIRASEVADFGARYFTPAEEIPLAGHPTLASVAALVHAGRVPVESGRARCRLELPAGTVTVDVRADDHGGRHYTMEQLRPEFGVTLEPEVVARAFGIASRDLLPGAPLQVVSTGTPQLMVPLREREVLDRTRLVLPEYSEIRAEAGFFSAHLFALGGFTADGDTAARHFGVPPDTLEDPFTGSATGGMGAYLWHHGYLEKPTFRAEQGHPMGRPGVATVEVVGPREAITTVRVGGGAVVVIEGVLHTQERGEANGV